MTEQDASDPEEVHATESGAAEAAGDADGVASGADGVASDADGETDHATAGDAEEFPFADVEVDPEFEPDFDGEVDDELVERIEEADPESVATELAALHARVDSLTGQLEAREAELDEVTSKLKQERADFQNYKKRMDKRREQERQRATEDLVERLIDVRDNLLRALDQDEDTDIRGGVETTLRVFDDALDAENVEFVEPQPGTEVDPHRHEVLARVESGAPEGTIADLHRPGYVMAEKVLRPAQVTVSEGNDDGDESPDDTDESG